MNTITLKITEIKPYEKNPRFNDNAVEAVKESIKQCGYISPIIVDENNVVLAGHTRLKAIKELGWKEVEVIRKDNLTEEQKKKYRILDNKTSEYAEWDYELLKGELDGLDFGDLEIDWGLPEEEIETIEDDFDIDNSLNETPKSKLGDIYTLGNHRLMCGDSTNESDVAKLIGGIYIDMIFTDPPYGMNLDTDFSDMKNHLDFAKEKGFKGGKKYEQGIVDVFDPKMIDLIMSLNVKETFLWGADYYAELLPNKNDGSWIVWDKRANGNDDIEKDYSSDKMYGSCFELCWSKNKHKRDIARVKWAGVFGTEQEFDHKRYHPTQKPIKLCEWFIKKYSDNNEKILDLFGGSGSTMIACEQLNRQCYMMEYDPKYVDVIINRWEEYTGKKAIKINERGIK